MEFKFVKILGLVSLVAGALLILTGFFITPGFVASHISSTGILPDKIIQGIQLLRLSAVSIGIFAAIFGALSLLYPSMVNRFFDFASRLGERFQSRYIYLPFCFACFLIALILGLLITQSGPGISPDSTFYINVGENLYHGNGVLAPGAYSDIPYVVAGPLYPLSIAGFMHLGFDAEQAARLIPILCFALLAFPLFFLGKITNDVFTGYVACLMVLVFTPLLMVTSHAWTEMVYIFFSILAILLLVKFVQSNRGGSKLLCMAGFLAALAILTKYIGVTLLLTGLIVVVIKNKSQLRKMVYQTLLFGSISCLPIIPWLYRNTILASNFSGHGWAPSNQGLLDNVNTTIVTILNDFVFSLLSLWSPAHQWLLSHLHFYGYIGLASIVAACFILLAVYVKTHSADKKVWQKYLGKNYVVISYIFIYFITIITVRSISFAGMDFRSTSPDYPFLILAVLSFVFYAYSQIKKPSLKPALFSVITVLCVLFLAFQVSISLVFYSFAKEGQAYNSAFWRNSQGIAWVASNVPDSAIVYSDFADVIRFRLKRPAAGLPYSENQEEIEEFFETLEKEEDSFIIGFKGAPPSYLLSNAEITEMNQKYGVLVRVADFPDSTIWRVH